GGGESDDAQTLAGPDGCAGDGICAWHHDLRSGGRRAGGRPDPRSVRRERRQPDRHRRRLSACGSERHVGGDHRPLAQAESGQTRHARPGDQVPRPDGRLRQLRGSISALAHPRLRDEPPPAADRLHRPLSSAPVGPCHSDRRDPRRVRHPRALGESSLHRGLEFHRLAARADRADRPAHGGLGPGFAAAAVHNMLAREIEWEIVPVCVEEGLGILPWGPLAQGWLSGKYTREAAPSGATRLGEDPNRGLEAYDRRNVERTWRVVDAVQAVASELGVPPARVALRWLADRPAVAAPLLGARTADQLRDNLMAAEITLSDEQSLRLDEES